MNCLGVRLTKTPAKIQRSILLDWIFWRSGTWWWEIGEYWEDSTVPSCGETPGSLNVGLGGTQTILLRSVESSFSAGSIEI